MIKPNPADEIAVDADNPNRVYHRPTERRETALIRCKRDGCYQVLARSGERGDVYPVVVGAYVDSDGRVCVTCPSCGERNRLPTRRVA